MAPLVELGPGAGMKYAAWTHRDKKALEEDLPPLDEGTGKWIRTFEKKTAGEALCMGDVRSILTSLSTCEVLKDVEKKAGTYRLPDNQEFDPVRNDFWDQLRIKYPAKDLGKAPLEGVTHKPHESASEYLTRCANQWADHTGEPYSANNAARAMFRMALIGGLPKEVQAALENVVGLANKPRREWEDHIRHFTEKYNSRLRNDLLMDPMISYSTEGVNTAEQLTKGNGGAPHNCSQHITEQLRARSDLRASPLKGKDVETWFTDGCCYKDPQGNNIASWAVVRQERNDDHRYDSRPEYATLRHGVLEDRPSAQKAELMAVIQALEMADKLRLNIYTDSNYVYEMAHLNATQAKVREWKTSTGLPVKHQALVQRLLCAIQLPQEVAILKCKGHSKETTSIARGNEAADEAAKLAGGYVQPTASMLTLMPKSSDTQEPSMHEMLGDLKTMQSYASDYERNYWLDQGCTLDSIGVYRSKLGKPVLANKTAVMMGHLSIPCARTLCTRLIETTLRKEQLSERVAQMALLQYEGGDNKSDDEDCAVFKDSGLV
ncbi:Gag-pol polyprotein [Merluccius polli]|uniref:Gag-pol polyprotein n=1 Tax=Merluccius polli TaxID=89951 RepID=A0AA47MV86_MERPO|nr:Gag-pol polyprotein [Merluccius polli]